ncbi:MAG: hypothetical protein KAT05_03520, partial [Spirochaetes bacterium]|nr:hypothetical protein [Spirochaetota bacterium]
MPDLLGFHSRRIRISKRFLKEKVLVEKDDKIRSHIAGMTAHLDLDNWFHHSDFFKEKVTFLQNDYIKFNDKKDKLPHF